MQVIETLREGLRRGCAVTLSAAELDARIDRKLEAASGDVERNVATEGRVFSKAMLETAVQEGVAEALRERLAGSGERLAQQTGLELKSGQLDQGGDVEVELTYEVLPAVPEIDFTGIKLEKPVAEVDEAAVGEALDKLARTANNFEHREAGAGAQEGDQVVFDFVGKLAGQPFQGNAAENYALVLGSNTFVPGFEAQLIGARAGESLEVEVRMPADYGSPQLAGKDVVFDCKVKKVLAPAAVPVDDDLARRFGVDSLAALKAQLAERLAEDYAGAVRSVVKRRLLDALDALVRFELPPSLVEAEAVQIAHHLWHGEHPEAQGHDHGAIGPTAEHRAIAERRLRLGLLFAAVGDRAGITVSDAERRQAMERHASQHPGREQEVFESLKANQQAQRQLTAPLFEDKVVDHILGLAQVTEKPVSKEDLRQALQELDAE